MDTSSKRHPHSIGRQQCHEAAVAAQRLRWINRAGASPWQRRQCESILGLVEFRKFLRVLEDLTMSCIIVDNDDSVTMEFVMGDQPRGHLGDDRRCERIIEIADESDFVRSNVVASPYTLRTVPG